MVTRPCVFRLAQFLGEGRRLRPSACSRTAGSACPAPAPRLIIAMIGVMPMPPAMNRKSCARCGRPKSLTGGATISSSPAFTRVDQLGRAAASVRLALDRDLIAVALGRIVAQRIFAQQPVRHLDGDMRAGGKFRQRLVGGVAEFDQVDAVGDSARCASRAAASWAVARSLQVRESVEKSRLRWQFALPRASET